MWIKKVDKLEQHYLYTRNVARNKFSIDIENVDTAPNKPYICTFFHYEQKIPKYRCSGGVGILLLPRAREVWV